MKYLLWFEAPLTDRVILADALGAGVLGCPMIEMVFVAVAGVRIGVGLLAFPVNTRLLVLLLPVGLAVIPVVDLYSVGTGGGWTAAVAGVTVTKVPDNGLEAVALTSTPTGLTETVAGLAGRVPTAYLLIEIKRKL